MRVGRGGGGPRGRPVVDRQAVLVGVVSGDEERRQVVDAISGVEGVKGVTDWLLLPEPGYMAVRPKLR